MKKIFLVFLCLLIMGCEPGQQLTLRDFENKTVVLSAHEMTLEPMQIQDFFIGIKNEFNENITFYISTICQTSNCEDNIRVQTFPLFSIGPNKSAAIPIRVEVLKEGQKGTYTFTIVAKGDNRTLDSDEFTIDVPVTIEEIKESAFSEILN